MPSMEEPSILIRGLIKSFGKNQVIRGIDLDVAPGQVFGYIGPNGAGKSTTVKILVGMLQGFKGTVEVAGIDVNENPLEVKRRIGYVPENAELYAELTVQEHLLLVGRLQGLSDELVVDRSAAILEQFDLGARSHSRIGSLSKGMRQKVMFTAALLHNPDILFLDEPLSGLDVHSTVLVKELVSALAKSGKTIFYCSHMMDVVERVCDRIAILSNGVIAAEGSFAELTAQSEDGGSLERIFLELTKDNEAADSARSILEAVKGTPNA